MSETVKRPAAPWQQVRQRAGTALARAGEPRSGPELLGIYLNDHLAGATSGTELARRIGGTHEDPADRAAVRRLAGEIGADRQTLLGIMATLDVPVRRYKTTAAWAGEKVARLKLNGQLFNRSPLSSLVELEALAIGVQGKAAGWRTLRELAGSDDRLSVAELDELIARAARQAGEIEDLRVRAATRLLQTGS